MTTAKTPTPTRAPVTDAKTSTTTMTRTTAKPAPKSTPKATPNPSAKTAARQAATNAKPAPAARSKPATKPASAPIPEATKPKHKLVRDSFTIPKSEYVVLEALKLRAAKLARPTKKSEVLRAGIAALAALGDKAFLAALGDVPSLKTGRPKGGA